MNRHTFLAIMLIALFTPFAAYPQDNSLQLKQALQLHREYKFSQAIDIYRSILEQRPDSTLKTESDSAYNMSIASRLITSENGSNMLSKLGEHCDKIKIAGTYKGEIKLDGKENGI